MWDLNNLYKPHKGYDSDLGFELRSIRLQIASHNKGGEGV